jgi:hypothetical protein
MLNKKYNQELLFREVQRFRQLWLWFLVLAVAGIITWVLVRQVAFDVPMGNHPLSDYGLLGFAAVFAVGLPVFFYTIHLTTELAPGSLYLKFIPLHFRWQRIPLESIQSAEAVYFRPFVDYGGYGIRYGRAGKAYNVSGNRGVRLVLVNGKRILIGSQRADELARALKAAMRNRR